MRDMLKRRARVGGNEIIFFSLSISYAEGGTRMLSWSREKISNFTYQQQHDCPHPEAQHDNTHHGRSPSWAIWRRERGVFGILNRNFVSK